MEKKNLPSTEHRLPSRSAGEKRPPPGLGGGTHKFKQKGVLSEGTDTAGKAQHRHDTPNHDEQPHRVKASQVRQRRDVGKNTLGVKGRRAASSSEGLTLPNCGPLAAPARLPQLTFSPHAQRPIARNRAPSTYKSQAKSPRVGHRASAQPLSHRGPNSPNLGSSGSRRRREVGGRAVHGTWGLPTSSGSISVLFSMGTAWKN